MQKIILTGALLCLGGTALAQEHTLTTYTRLSPPEYHDAGAAGPSVGDMYLRYGEVALTPDGPVVGDYYTQATLVFHDEQMGKSARSFKKEFILPEGSIYTMDFVALDHGKPVEAEHVSEGAIIGGTGEYAGIRGTYTLRIAPSGDSAETTLRYWLGK